MDDEQKLPAGHLPHGKTPPLWFDIPRGPLRRDPSGYVLKKISQLPEMKGLSTTVIYEKDEDVGVKKICQKNDWNFREVTDMAGCEDECVILLDNLGPEAITRSHNLLIVVTTAGHK